MHVQSSCVLIKYHMLEILVSLLTNVPREQVQPTCAWSDHYMSMVPETVTEIIAIQQWRDVFQ